MIWPHLWARDSAIVSSLNPQPALAERDPVFPVFPLHVAVAGFLERERLEAGGLGEGGSPLDHRDVDPVRSRVADDKARTRRPLADTAQGLPRPSDVQEVASHHQV